MELTCPKCLANETIRLDLCDGDTLACGGCDEEYVVAHWVIPGVPGSEVLEYLPRFSDLPRVTVATYADQAAVHRALGVRLVGPGRKFREFGHARAS